MRDDRQVRGDPLCVVCRTGQDRSTDTEEKGRGKWGGGEKEMGLLIHGILASLRLKESCQLGHSWHSPKKNSE